MEQTLQNLSIQLARKGVYSSMIYKNNRLVSMLFYIKNRCIEVIVYAKALEVKLNHTSRFISKPRRDLRCDGNNLFVKGEKIKL